MPYRMIEEPGSLRITFTPRIGWKIIAGLGVLYYGVGSVALTHAVLALDMPWVGHMVLYYLCLVASTLMLLHRQRLEIDDRNVVVSAGYAGIMRRRCRPVAGARFEVPVNPHFLSKTVTPGVWLRVGDIRITSMVLSRQEACRLAERLNNWIEGQLDPRLTSASS